MLAFGYQGIPQWGAAKGTEARHYQITVKGHLDVSWSSWFDGLTITHDADGNTKLSGVIRDQTALYGLIDKARDLALTLIAIEDQTPN